MYTSVDVLPDFKLNTWKERHGLLFRTAWLFEVLTTSVFVLWLGLCGH